MTKSASRHAPLPRNPLKGSHKDREQARVVLDTPQTRSAAYRLAFDDQDFLCSPEMRGVRLQLEMMKAETRLQEAGIVSTCVLFGGARIPAPGMDPWAAKNDTQRKNLTAASRYYTEARTYAQLASTASAKTGFTEHVVVTGGGPGVMEAGSRGAVDAGAPNIGLNIVLPFEQAPNPYVTPDLAFNFHYFAIRKMHFLMRAASVAVFPGGFGTLDEFFETLTLIQTGRMDRVPVLLFGREFWNKAINIEALAEAGTIGPDDHELFTIVDTAEEGWQIVAEHHGLEPGSVAHLDPLPASTTELIEDIAHYTFDHPRQDVPVRDGTGGRKDKATT